jgi:hypothetical protein
MTTEQRIPYLFFPVRAVDTVVEMMVLSVMVGVNLADGDYWNVAVPRPGHHPSDPAQNPPVIAYTRMAIGQEKIPLRVDIYQHTPAPSFEQLTNHFRFPSNVFPAWSYNCYALQGRRFAAVIE